MFAPGTTALIAATLTRTTSGMGLQAGGQGRRDPRTTFHDLRRTGASLMIAAGCHVKVSPSRSAISDGGGLVLKRYGHLYPGDRRQAAVVFEAHILAGSAIGPWTGVDDGRLGLDLDPA